MCLFYFYNTALYVIQTPIPKYKHVFYAIHVSEFTEQFLFEFLFLETSA